MLQSLAPVQIAYTAVSVAASRLPTATHYIIVVYKPQEALLSSYVAPSFMVVGNLIA